MAFTSDIVKTKTLNNGSKINLCKFSNGKTDYCTTEDAKNAMRLANNPKLGLSKKELAKMSALDAQVKKLFL